jgi:hypothetical protein
VGTSPVRIDLDALKKLLDPQPPERVEVILHPATAEPPIPEDLAERVTVRRSRWIPKDQVIIIPIWPEGVKAPAGYWPV